MIRDRYPAMSTAIDAAAKSALRPSATARGSLLGCSGTTVPPGTSCHAEKNMVHSSPAAAGGITSAAVMPAVSYADCLSRRR